MKTDTTPTSDKKTAKKNALNLNFQAIIAKNGAESILDEWEYNIQETADIETAIKTNEPSDLDTAMNIVRRIALWKLDRVISINDEMLKKGVEFDEKTIETFPKDGDPWWEEVEKIIDELVGCKGIGLPMASTILHFYHPDTFLIIDQRAYRVIFPKLKKLPPRKQQNGELYVKYMLKCIRYYKENNFSFEFKFLDRFTYQLDKKAENPVES